MIPSTHHLLNLIICSPGKVLGEKEFEREKKIVTQNYGTSVRHLSLAREPETRVFPMLTGAHNKVRGGVGRHSQRQIEGER